MDKSELDKLIKKFTGLAKNPEKLSSEEYEAPPSVKNDDRKLFNKQKRSHRNVLLGLVITLSCLSFIFLVVIISIQMRIRLDHPSYKGVSDTVINIIAVSVFAQVIAVVGVIAGLIFKD